MEKQSRVMLLVVMALVALAGLTVIQQSSGTKGIATGLSMFVIAIGFVFYTIREVMGGSGHSRH